MITRTLCKLRHTSVGRRLCREFRFSASNHDSQTTQPQTVDEKFDFEDLKVLERTERRKAAIEPFMKNIFVSKFDRELLAFPEILNKEESESLDRRAGTLEKIFADSSKTKEERREALQKTLMYSAPVALTHGGLAMNFTESVRYLESISSDVDLSMELCDHWVGLKALQSGLTEDQFQQIVGDLTTGDKTISLCIKEKLAERITQADFRTVAELNSQNVWTLSGEKLCLHTDGYLLVLAMTERDRLKAFLIHPGAEGVSQNGNYVTFTKTPATPLDQTSDEQLARTLSVSRLFAATLCRCAVQRAMFHSVDYVKPLALAGKPLSEIPIIRSTIGEALLDVYASQSAEYFTAGLLDGYLNPDAEIEVAMCREFISSAGERSLALLERLAPEATPRKLDTHRLLSSRGESLHGGLLFIAMNGLHYAGKAMAEEIKQIRNPLFNPSFIFKKVMADRHQERDDPKLTLFLAEHLHPTLKLPSEQLEYSVLRMRYACETLMSRHGVDVHLAHTELVRLAEAATYILVMTAVLARASRAYCIGLRNAEVEMKLAACFVENSKDRVRKLIKDIDDGEFLNLDHFKVGFGKKVFETNSTIVELPTARTFW